MDYSLKLLKDFLIFSKNLPGVVNSPYITMRKISQQQEGGQVLFIFLLAVIYFIFATALRTGLRNPYLLTLELNRLIFFASLTFVLFCLIIFLLGMSFGGRGTLKSFYLCWSYSLIPTIIWFFITSISYLLLPPPRTLSFPGKLFSLLFITISITLLFWKIVLFYLSLRFSLKLDLVKIAGVSLILTPILGIYGILMYRLGVFRIPFI